MMLMPMASNEQKSHDAPPFDHLDLTNGMVPLMTPLASCDNDTSIMALNDQNCYNAHCFNCLDLMNTMMLLTMALPSHDASANSVK